MNKCCKNCKFCEKRLILIESEFKLMPIYDYKYFCKFMPEEKKTKPDNWCGQFKPKFENEDDQNEII